MAQYTGRQYDDDLTGETEKYNESLSTGFVDLFESLGDDDATIAQLKTIIISLDWEITDDILQQLHNELLDLKDIWAGNKIHLIYIQALEKISHYIATEKAKSHPNAIKLLLAFYYNLEKIVSSASMSDAEKKQLLLQDVKRFEQFKNQVSSPSQDKGKIVTPPVATVVPVQKNVSTHELAASSSPGKREALLNLKAIVLGLDWEINDQDLMRLSEEVAKLEFFLSDSRVKLIFLQGIGALGNYIRSTKSNAHPKSFKLLHSFSAGLERICHGGLTSDKEKEILLAEVKKFNEFKAVIAPVSSKIVVPVQDAAPFSADKKDIDIDEDEDDIGGIAPAFADMPDNIRGFRADSGFAKDEIDQGVAKFLGEKPVITKKLVDTTLVSTSSAQDASEVISRLDALFGSEENSLWINDSATKALEGVEVETEADDDSDEKALPSQGGQLVPALAESAGEQQRSIYTERTVTAPVEPVIPVSSASEEKPLITTGVIPGVDVDSEADDDSDEDALPIEFGEIAPALAFTGQDRGFRETDHLDDTTDNGDDSDLEDRLTSFFGEEISIASQEISPQSVIDLGAVEKTLPEPSVDEIHSKTSEQIVVEELLDDFFGIEQEEESEKAPTIVESPLTDTITVETPTSLQEVMPVEPALADFIFAEVSAISTEAMDTRQEVIFEPVGDDVEVDELPQ